MNKASPIAIFDSGVGGLTVYRALRELLPHENFVYLGDTARVPYGPKSPELVTQYSLQIAARLLQEDIKLLVVACNTATARALPTLRARYPDLPIIGVVEPGAKAAAAATRKDKILILATAGTVQSGAYANAIRAIRPDCAITGIACGILVTMVEEGWTEGPEAAAVLTRYLRQAQGFDYDTVVLGCTHFPLLYQTLQSILPAHISIVDSASTTAIQVRQVLHDTNLLKHADAAGWTRFLVTDSGRNFHAVAAKFLDQAQGLDIDAIDLGDELPSLAVA
jgi:glutamate racemase